MTKTARFLDMKQQGQKIAVLTGYDAPTAKAEEDSGVDIILVGDSVGSACLAMRANKRLLSPTCAIMWVPFAAARRKYAIIADLPFQQL